MYSSISYHSLIHRTKYLLAIIALGFISYLNGQNVIFVSENFNSCGLPQNWTIDHPNLSYANIGSCDDSEIGIYNTLFSFSCTGNLPFEPGQNGAGGASGFDGCIAVIDDYDTGSSISSPGAEGMGCIITDIYNTTNYSPIWINYDYQVEPLSNFGDLKVDVWYNGSWYNVATRTSSSNGNDHINVTEFSSTSLRVRFCYDDQGQWAFGAAIDNFELEGNQINPDPTCTDGIQNGTEQGIDCGGPCPTACETCFDGLQNQNEVGIDCGGVCMTSCATCFDGIQNQDELGIDCGGVCALSCASCSDGILNQDETNIDCGGVCSACPNCFDNVQNGLETGIDCGGICQSCPSCVDGIQNGTEQGIDCGGICVACPVRVKLRTFFEGYYNPATNQMSNSLNLNGLIPLAQPFNIYPYFVNDEILLTSLSENVVDWVLVQARDKNDSTIVLSQSVGLINKNGTIVSPDESIGLVMENISENEQYYFAIFHKGHLPILTSLPVTVPNNITYDFTFSDSQAAGVESLKLVGTKYIMYAGDFNGDAVINATDYNLWAQNSALVNIYLPQDADGNSVINSLDYNIWYANRSKTAFSLLIY